MVDSNEFKVEQYPTLNRSRRKNIELKRFPLYRCYMICIVFHIFIADFQQLQVFALKPVDLQVDEVTNNILKLSSRNNFTIDYLKFLALVQ